MRLVKLNRLRQLRLRELLRVLGPHRTRPDNANVAIDWPLMAYQSCDLIDRQAGFPIESASIPVDVVIPVIGARVIVELADLHRTLPPKVLSKLALFLGLVAIVRQTKGHNLACDVVEDGRVGGLRLGAENVAVGFWGVGLAGCFTSRFVGAPLASLAVLAAVSGALASTAFESAGF